MVPFLFVLTEPRGTVWITRSEAQREIKLLRFKLFFVFYSKIFGLLKV